MPAEQDDPTGADWQEWTDLAANEPFRVTISDYR